MVGDRLDERAEGTGRVREPVAERMQALLSRAVEDQIGEQRQIAAVIGELREQIATLGAAYRSTASEVAVERLSGEVGARAAELRTAGAGVEQQLAEVGRRLAEVGEVAAESGRRLERLEALTTVSPEQLGEAVETLSGRLSPLPAALGVLQVLDGRLGGVEGSLTGVAEQLGGLGVRLTALDAPVAEIPAVAAGVTRLSGEVAALPGRVSVELLDSLAPRVAELVLEHAQDALVDRIADAAAARVVTDLPAVLRADLRADLADTERRVLAHVDDAVLVLAEALLRRRRSLRIDLPAGPEVPRPAAADAPGASPTEDAAAPAAAAVPAGPGQAGPAQADPAHTEVAAAAPGPYADPAPPVVVVPTAAADVAPPDAVAGGPAAEEPDATAPPGLVDPRRRVSPARSVHAPEAFPEIEPYDDAPQDGHAKDDDLAVQTVVDLQETIPAGAAPVAGRGRVRAAVTTGAAPRPQRGVPVSAKDALRVIESEPGATTDGEQRGWWSPAT